MNNATEHKNTYLGLDIGTASIGYALIEVIDEINGSIIASGVRIFPEALEGTSEYNKKPKNVERREKRLRRRQIRHKKLKQKRIREILCDARLLPSAEESVLEQTPKNTSPNQPYELRKRALNEKLDPYELGRVFTHISRRIGFGGSIKKDKLEEDEKTDEEKEQEKKENEIKGEIKHLKKEMKNKTLGTYLADLPSQERKRGRHIGRLMVEDEFNAIWNKQQQYHPDLLTKDLKDSLKEAIFGRRPTFWRLKSIGKCLYEPKSPLLMKADWKAQQYIMLQNLNNLRVFPNKRQLKPEERQLVYDLMMSSAKVSFSSIRKKLKNYWKENNIPTSKFTFEDKSDEREYLPGNATEALLRRVLGDDYASLPCYEKIKLEIAEQKFNVEYRKILEGYSSQHKGWRVEILNADKIKEQKKIFVQKAVNDWQITKEQAEKLVDAPLPKGWIRFSEKVVDQILPQLEEGKEFQTTLKEIYPPHEYIMDENRDKLPSHHKVFSDIRNPVVVRCLNETRKVVNNLIAAHGKPDYVRIELARNIKLTGKDKKKSMEINKKRRAQREEAKKFFSQPNHPDPTPLNIKKYVLWKESNERCLYSGDSICADDLFNRGKYQIEHIMPYSRSYDDSLNNLLLCKTEMNLQKGNRIPYEAFSGDTALWEEMVRRVKNEKKLPKSKIKRFIRKSYHKELDEEQKKSRLTDTGYATRRIRDFIATLYSKKNAVSWTEGQPPRVQVVNGQITSQIGRAWGVYYKFNKKFIGQYSTKKIRDDHRHHTLDAIIVALTSIGRAEYIEKRFREQREKEIAYEEIVNNLKLQLPWREFHKDVHDALENIIVSYRVDAKVSGSFTKDTHIRMQAKENELRYVKRINLSDATAEQIRSICDEQVRDLVWKHVRKYDEKKVMPEKPEDKPWLNDKTVSKKTMTASINSAIKEAFKDNNQPLHMTCKKRNKNGKIILGPVIKKVRICVKQEEHPTIPVHAYKRNNKEINIVAEKGDNHHVALYRKDNGNIEKRVISKLEAQQRIQKGKPLIEPKYNGLPLIFSYCKRDVFVKIDPETDKLTYHRVDAIGPIQVTLYPHTMSSKLEKKQPSHHLLIENGYWKITVDPIGRISLVNKNLAFDYLPNLKKHFE